MTKNIESLTLKTICNQFLDNANLNIYIDNTSHNVRLEFFVFGIPAGVSIDFSPVVTFDCKNIISYQFKKEWDEQDGYYRILETDIKQIKTKDFLKENGNMFVDENAPKNLWLIEVIHAISLKIVCADFNWSIRAREEDECDR
ncbi:MAG: hypothetical protein AAGA60_19400 [Cyanobacteria bacterium P01_E01_bin.42]